MITKRSAILAAGLFLTACVTSDDTSDPQPDDPVASVEQEVQHPELGGPAQLTGTLTIAGCTPSPARLRVFVEETTFAVPPGPPNAPPDQGVTLKASIFATNDPHTFEFRFPTLKQGSTYRLGALTTFPACGKVAWRGPHGGLVTVGVSVPTIEGFAMRTQTEILGKRNQTAAWLGIDALDFSTLASGKRRLRWKTTIPGVAGGIVEIAADRFPSGAGALQNQPALIASIPVAWSQQGWSQVPAIDLAALVKSTCSPQSQNVPCVPSALAAQKNALANGAPFYIRVVPIDGAGNRLIDTIDTGISSWVKAARTPLPEAATVPPPPPAPPLATSVSYQPAQPEVASTLGGRCYRTIKDHPIAADIQTLGPVCPSLPAGTPCFCFRDFHGWREKDQLGNSCSTWGWPAAYTDYYGWRLSFEGHPPGSTVPAGTFFCLAAPSRDFLDDVFDAVTGLVDAIGYLVDQISRLYEELKLQLVKAVSKVLSDYIGLFECDATCEAYLMTALNAALAAMGMPPSIPSWNQLVAEGKDYLIKLAANETGVPEEFVAYAEGVVEDVIGEMNAHRGISGTDWITPDDGFVPPLVRLHLDRNWASTLETPTMLRVPGAQYYRGTELPLPHQLADGDHVDVPVVLLPNVDTILPPLGTCTTFCGGAWGSHCDPAPTCFPPSENQKRVHYEHVWYDSRYAATFCTQVSAKALLATRLGDGSLWTTADYGTQIDVAFQTLGPIDVPIDGLTHLCAP